MNKGGCFYDLHIPSLEEIGQKFSGDLSSSFACVSCSVVDCPDLTKEPFCLPSKGMCGNVMVADVGGVGNLQPYPRLDRIYDMVEIAKMFDQPRAFIFGAAAGPFHKIGSNCELIPNLTFTEGKVNESGTLIAMLKNDNNTTFLTNETEFGILGQFHCSEGQTGKVIKMNLSERKKDGSILTFLQASLAKHYGDRSNSVYISGIIVMETGIAKIHVMSDFIDEPLDSAEKVNNWLRFFNVEAPFVGLAVIGSHDPMHLGLRLVHCHGFTADRSIAGHFHRDITGDTVSYTAYFVVAERCLRQDKI